MDYLDQVRLERHTSWEAFEAWRNAEGARLILFTTRARTSYLDHAFRRDDVLLFGRESAGVPDNVHAAADARLDHSDAGGLALVQCGDGRRHGGGRSDAAGRSNPGAAAGTASRPRILIAAQHEAGEGHSHAPRRCPSPASLAGRCRHKPLAISPCKRGDITLPDIPRTAGFLETMAKKRPARIFPCPLVFFGDAAFRLDPKSAYRIRQTPIARIGRRRVNPIR